jgi:hypothetical protein
MANPVCSICGKDVLLYFLATGFTAKDEGRGFICYGCMHEAFEVKESDQ